MSKKTILGSKRKKSKSAMTESDFEKLADELTSLAEANDLEPDDFSSWEELADELCSLMDVEKSDFSDAKSLIEELENSEEDEEEDDEEEDEEEDSDDEDSDDEDSDEDDTDEDEDEDEDADEDADDDAEEDGEDDSSLKSKASIFITGEDRMKKEEKRAERRAAASGKPTVFFKDGDEKVLRFRDEQPLFMIYVHNVQLGRGKWSYGHICTDGTGVECEFCASGSKPALIVVYEVIDRTGFKDKKGKLVKNRPVFFETTMKRHKSLEALSKKVGLTTRDISVSRIGDGTDTTYSFIPLEKSSSKADKSIPRLSKEIKKYYITESPKEQRRILGTT